jgi:hypothetical protein
MPTTLIRIGLLFLILAAVPVQAQDVFGIKPGQSISNLKVVKKGEAPHSYVVEPPIKNPEADFFTVIATPETGVCKVSMLGKTYEHDAYGTEGRRSFVRLNELLEAKYGSPSDSHDFVKHDSIWKDDKYFAMSLQKMIGISLLSGSKVNRRYLHSSKA